MEPNDVLLNNGRNATIRGRNSDRNSLQHDDVVTTVIYTETHPLAYRYNHDQQNQILGHPTQFVTTRQPQQPPIDEHQTPNSVTEQLATSSDREQLSQEEITEGPTTASENQPVQPLFHGQPAGQYLYVTPFQYQYFTNLYTGHQVIVEQPIQHGIAMVHAQPPNTADVTEITIETKQQAPSTSVNNTIDTEIKTGTDSQTSQTTSTIKSQAANIKLSSNCAKIAAQKQTPVRGQNKRITTKESNKKEIPGPKRKPVSKK
ncbi:unnamed protein product [Mytilus coruscus]|uniref:Uncharacterized protein n=1 Tax=Mytilus coruscus TaxID=42192 RepID=A0A6J8DD05_MYTCO|nr:unnamed protein product [Mytilus coruscus]